MSIVNICMVLIISFINYYFILRLFQEYHYHLHSFLNIIKKIFINKINYLLLFPIILLFVKNEILNIIVIFILSLYIYLRIKRKYVLKLKITKRIIRFLIIKVLLTFSILYLYNPYYLIYLDVPLIILSYFILYPVEHLINKYYMNKAKSKIKRVRPLIIGITGSCGKTTCKHILYNILKDKYVCFMTPQSYNTALGISKSINEDMNEMTEIAIIEFGASHKGDIKKSLDICKPEISLITNIGIQHLETFKSINNIIEEKTLLMKNSKVHFYNKLSKYNIDCGESYSFSKVKGANFYLRNINITKEGSFFEICDNKNVISFETKLLGENNLINIVSCVAICRYLGLSYDYIKKKVEYLKPVPSRLELIQKGELTIINDSFNSNKNGFIEALNVINMFESKRAIITPGVVTGGVEMEAINEDIAYKIMNMDIDVYLVSSISTPFYEKVFKEKEYKYQIFKTFKDAYATFEKESYKSLLIENDITDIYERRIK